MGWKRIISSMKETFSKESSLKHLAVCVPTLPGDLDNIILSHIWWSQHSLPFLPDDSAKAEFTLIYLFPECCDPALEKQISDSFEEYGLSRFFHGLRFVFAELDSEKNHYIRDPLPPPPNEFGLKSGPNYLFFHMIDHVAPDYDCILQMETDCVAIRSGWLNCFSEVEQSNPESWVIGSLYHGPKLPEPWTDHLNGNAIIRSGSPEFQKFFTSIWKRRVETVVKYQRPELAFDCAWVEYLYAIKESGNTPAETDSYNGRFQSHDLIANMTPGIAYPLSIPPLEDLKSQMKSTFIVHGSWLLPEIRRRCNQFSTNDKIAPQERNRSTVVANGPPENSDSWIWIKGFHASRRAWLEHNDFVLPTNNSSLSWRIDPSVLPSIHLTVLDQEPSQLIVQIFAYPRSRLRRARRLIEDFYSYGIRGTRLILAGLQRILRTTRNAQAYPLFPHRNLTEWECKHGEQIIDLKGLDIPPNRDICIHVKNGGQNALLGKIDFKVERNPEGTPETESPIGPATSGPTS